ncbi:MULTISPECIES: FtsW/RodA/SpoVE family cell cycle protein [unclassified Exiguobacterium]|uniref:FtsW/RodA/SpoVE family cell cycle protein n=1 Tax=unclassified Exiguobacterium TaxID=2644629 RepID=UPI00103C18B5|nr:MULTISPECIES: FtsW/RodA/SpoVE family cell cycle protein [unclassified Exiguobacterium]TCI45585.1 FtsW/RodA/SpoVE family cell cycle protein [Exiguobacterium sp. SH5S32]TCI52788.1 FtsW/RodA/SpoVE family cell cycle protein [Exiguobacterium sp. SH1S4]TCI65558.1 FtsW/RodA/SpoVE family cell cycle protein [Exiguobacterium sp. SH0S2]TCI70978.1 FtsW/RodA/SpoVE family cell cycle protein [Exiguobacterium sp. SH1S1]
MKTRFRYFDFSLFIAVLLLVGISSIMIYSASVWNRGDYANSGLFYRQLFYAGFGIVVYLIATMFRYENFRKKNVLRSLYALSVILLFVTWAMPPLNGARAWLIIGGFTIQPIEIAKFVLILLLANYYHQLWNRELTGWPGRIGRAAIERKKLRAQIGAFFIIPGLFYFFPYAFVINGQPDHGGLFVLGVIMFMMWLAAGAPLRIIIPVIIAGIGFVYAMYTFVFTENQVSRINVVFNPFMDPEGYGHQLLMSIISIVHGGLTGVGLGNSYQKYGYLPEPETDYIMSIIAEELGFIGVLVVLVLLFFIAFRAVNIANHTDSHFAMFVSFGIAAQIMVQTGINIGAMSGWFPGTGVTLPLVSYGGTSLIMTMGILGVLSSISMRNRHREATRRAEIREKSEENVQNASLHVVR